MSNETTKIIGTGMATTGLIIAGVGIGIVFGALILGIARNPSLRGQLFAYAILGFAFAEATVFINRVYTIILKLTIVCTILALFRMPFMIFLKSLDIYYIYPVIAGISSCIVTIVILSLKGEEAKIKKLKVLFISSTLLIAICNYFYFDFLNPYIAKFLEKLLDDPTMLYPSNMAKWLQKILEDVFIYVTPILSIMYMTERPYGGGYDPVRDPDNTQAPTDSVGAGSSVQPNAVAGPSSQPNPVAGSSSQPNPVAGPSSQPNPVVGPSSLYNPVVGPSALSSLRTRTGTILDGSSIQDIRNIQSRKRLTAGQSKILDKYYSLNKDIDIPAYNPDGDNPYNQVVKDIIKSSSRSQIHYEEDTLTGSAHQYVLGVVQHKAPTRSILTEDGRIKHKSIRKDWIISQLEKVDRDRNN